MSCPTGESLSGVISEIGQQIAFIHCDGIKEQFGKDVFCPASFIAASGMIVGTRVEFELMINAKGQPQAANVRASPGQDFLTQALGNDKRSASSTSVPTGLSCSGVIKEIGQRFVFIECEPVKMEYGKDVFCPADLVTTLGFQVGSSVEFDLMVNAKGQPQATNLRHPAPPPGASSSQSTPTGMSFAGTIQEVGQTYSFITCDTVKAQYGKDVFCPAQVVQSLGLAPGSEVVFDLMLNAKGQPQAANLRPAAGTAQVMQAPAHIPQVVAPPRPPRPNPESVANSNFASMANSSMTNSSMTNSSMANSNYTSTSSSSMWSGAVKELGRSFAFIDCEPLKIQYGKDVFCPAEIVTGLGLTVGSPVDFDLMVNSKGQPQAANLRPSAPALPSTATFQNSAVTFQNSTDTFQNSAGAFQNPASTFQKGAAKGTGKGEDKGKGNGQRTLNGTIQVIGKAHTFIHCEEIKAQCGKDVYFPTSHLAGFGVGDAVEFELNVNANGQPQASNLRPAQGFSSSGDFGMSDSAGVPGAWPELSSAWTAPNSGAPEPNMQQPQIEPTGPQAEMIGQTFTGNIAEVGKKFAFIDCEPVTAVCGKQVFCPAEALAGLSPGDALEFELMLNARGQPQAANARQSGTRKGARMAPY